MAKLEVETAVRARLTAGFTAAPVYDEGQFSVPTDASPFVVLQFPFNDTAIETLRGVGGNRFKEEGAFRVIINVRRKGSTGNVAQGKLWADQIATLFRNVQFGGVYCGAPMSPNGDNGNDEAGYYVLAIAVPYEFSFKG